MRTVTFLIVVATVAGCRRETPPAPKPAGPPPKARTVARAAKALVAWRRLDALWFRERTGKPALSGTTPISAVVTVNPERRVRVGVLEEYAGATGRQWRTSVWIAAFLASTLTGTPMTERRFSIATGGFIDGPSAGALMAVGFMAAITGAQIPRDRTLTGALGPDGSVLPVAGIPEKIRAAAAAGKKLVGIPAGQTEAEDSTGKKQNVIALGKSLGVRVREVTDLHEAYTLLTGQRIPGPQPVPLRAMELEPRFASTLRSRIPRWLARAARDAQLAAKDSQPVVQSRVARARSARALVRRRLAGGHVACAYLDAFQAAVWSRAALRLVSLSGDSAAAERSGSFGETRDTIERLEKDLEAASRTANQSPAALLAAYGAAARARGFLDTAEHLLGAAKRELRVPRFTAGALLALKSSGKGYLPAVFLSLSDLLAEIARDLLSSSSAGSLRFRPAALRQTARSLVSAASGNLEFIDALFLEEVAAEMKMSPAAVRRSFARTEVRYLMASQLAQLALDQSLNGRPGRAQALARLAAASQSYVVSGAVLAKYYGLGAELTPVAGRSRLKELPPRRTRSLDRLLQRAEVAARVAAARAQRRLGLIPPDAKLYYSDGRRLMHESASRKLRALSSFWRSTVASKVAVVVLAR